MAGRPKKKGTIKDEKSSKSYEEIMAFLSAEK